MPYLTYLVNGCEVGVGVGESGVDLNVPGVAIGGTLDVMHLLQSVAHVGVGVRKSRLDSGGGAKTIDKLV